MSRLAALVMAALGVAIAGCDQPEMRFQPKYSTYDEAARWPDNQAARQPVAGTVARDQRLEPLARTLPVALDRRLLDRGQERYEIFCSPCHAASGYGNGMVVQRGFPAPPSLHSERLRDAPLRHFVDVITEGFGVMYSYRDRVPMEDRWAIAAYLRALQLSQQIPYDTLSAAQHSRLETDTREAP
ncbi:Cytochrome C oxidase, cbb3-type, subunit III [Modicisalibacter ilicicola DSM 19980]|uniref:Cytochrome C oxidase, cbb3-type, subunit III n=1 Tax=Modicisalibacter ilicicola DSM 19980 TaxID=1121942 RepID=A0A1M5CIS5_9GAMM|nr:cytochrome c [Halomonas ilicicola]SHF54507.1 Cytochrome C oxidase, cbb3-type, subunit III [Halomonas ilicicola DSM 19980]